MLYEIYLYTIKNGCNAERLFYKSCKTQATKNKYHLQALRMFKQAKAETGARLAVDIRQNGQLVWTLEV